MIPPCTSLDSMGDARLESVKSLAFSRLPVPILGYIHYQADSSQEYRIKPWFVCLLADSCQGENAASIASLAGHAMRGQLWIYPILQPCTSQYRLYFRCMLCAFLQAMPESSRISAERLIQRVKIWQLHEMCPELSSVQLANRLGIPTVTVQYALRIQRIAPADMLKAYSHQAVKAWAASIPIASSKGDHKPARDLLLHTRQIDPVSPDKTAGVQIIFNTLSVPGLASFTGEKTGSKTLSISEDSGLSVTVTGENADPRRRDLAGDPAPAPACTAEIFSPKTSPVELSPEQEKDHD